MTAARATAPASSANLGPGFDCLALALDIRCAVTATASETWELDEHGSVTPSSTTNLVVRAAAHFTDRPLRLRIESGIPRARGMGSSAAVCTAAGAAAARSTGREPDSQELFETVAELEGHPDNAAAAVFGGLVLASGTNHRRLVMSSDLVPVVAIPHEPLPTRQARDVLPETVPHGAATRNLARLGFLIEGLRTGDPLAFAVAEGDELHESYRNHLAPLTQTLLKAARAGGALHAAWSGAGPTVLALSIPREVDSVIESLSTAIGTEGEVLQIGVAHAGWE